MGQILQADSIGALSHSSGVITLASSRLTIGGQQYSTSALNRTISTDVTLTSNTLYMIYVAVSGGVPVLRISSNVNSTGPAGFTAWKLVGAFFASGGNSFNGNTVEFGTFVTIEGVPKTYGRYNAGRLVFTAHTSDPVKGNGGVGNSDRLLLEIEGTTVKGYAEYAHNVAGSAGNGNYFLGVPFAINTNINQINSDSFSGVTGQWNAYSEIGSGHMSSNNSLGFLRGQPYDTTRIRWWVFNATTGGWSTIGGWGSNFFAFNNSDFEFSLSFEYQSSALSNTPLKDR